jgi:hypothetical protein
VAATASSHVAVHRALHQFRAQFGKHYESRCRVRIWQASFANAGGLRVDAFNPAALQRLAWGEIEDARYEASLAARRYKAVDPTKRLVAPELVQSD